MMKTLRATSVLFGAAILLLGAAARPASAGDYARGWGVGWGSYARSYASDEGGCECGSSDAGCGYCGEYRGYIPWGPNGACGCWPRAEYARYIVGHGPMFPGGEQSTGYSYMKPSSLMTPIVPPAPNAVPGPNPMPAPNAMTAPNGR